MRGGGSSSSASVAAVLAAVLGVAVSAQEVPRTSWGDPALKGIWVGSTLTPLERPSEYEGREFLSEEEVAALENAALVHEERLLARPAERALAGGDVDYRPDGSLGYDAFWLDEGTTWQPSGRTSVIVDPPTAESPIRPRRATTSGRTGPAPGTRTSTSTRGSGASATGCPKSGSATTRTTRSSRRRPTCDPARDVPCAPHHSDRRPPADRHPAVER